MYKKERDQFKSVAANYDAMHCGKRTIYGFIYANQIQRVKSNAGHKTKAYTSRLK